MKWLNLSEGLFMFGTGGITRVEPNVSYTLDGSKSPYITTLYCNEKKITIVQNSVDEIQKMLYNKEEE